MKIGCSELSDRQISPHTSRYKTYARRPNSHILAVRLPYLSYPYPLPASLSLRAGGHLLLCCCCPAPR
jgi:hypothetical protein|eukprot:COSAG01_NODE_3745_length_5742_cov_18.618901_2_plen_68_part_00